MKNTFNDYIVTRFSQKKPQISRKKPHELICTPIVFV